MLKEQSARLNRAAKERGFVASWKEREKPYEWLALWNVYPFAYQFINELVDRGQTSLRNFREKVFRPIAVQQHGRATAVIYDPAELALDGLHDSLWKTITLHPFPFRRCPTCKKIFVMAVKKQKFCEKKCANRAVGPETNI